MKYILFLSALLIAACGSDIRPVFHDHDSAVSDSTDVEGIPTDNITVEDIDSPDPDTLGDEIIIDEDNLLEDDVIDEVDGDATDMDHLNESVVSDIDSTPLPLPTRIWSYSCGVTNETLVDLVTDSLGNVYAVGQVPGSGILIHKFDSTGARTDYEFDGGDSLLVTSATISNDQIYITGSVTGSFEGFVSYGYQDFFLMKLSSNGDEFWVKQWGTAVNNVARDVAALSDGTILVTGETQTSVNPSSFSYDTYLAKFSPDGAKLKEVQWQPSDDVYSKGVAIAIGPNGTIFVSGVTGTFKAADAFYTTISSDLIVGASNTWGEEDWEEVVKDNAYTFDVVTLGRTITDEYQQVFATNTNAVFDQGFGMRLNKLAIYKSTLIGVGLGGNDKAYMQAVDSSGWRVEEEMNGEATAITTHEQNIFVGWKGTGSLAYVTKWRMND